MNAKTSNFIYFDNAMARIRAEHVIASGVLSNLPAGPIVDAGAIKGQVAARH